VSYFGAKSGSGVYQAIINLIPPHDTFIEAFLGSGVITQKKAPAQHTIGIDRDAEVLRQFSCAYPVETIHADFLEWIQDKNFDERTVIYCDPPYVHSTRSSQRRYRHELGDNGHHQLLDILQGLNCHVLLSGYKNPMYESKLADWWSFDFQAMTRGGVRTETVWCNFEPGEIHYHTYAGRDFTDRQRIKRKAERWANRYQTLPATERQAVLAALLTSDPEL
jgi:site-specific DNA-adenine methylase